MLQFRTAATALVGIVPVAAAGLLALVSMTPVGQAQTTTEAPGGDPVVAKVDGQELHLSDLQDAYGQLPPQAQQMGLEAVFPFLLDRMIDEKLLAIAAGKAITDDDPEVKKQMDRLRERVMIQVYFNRTLEEKITEERIREGYEQYLKANPPKEELRARHILVETEEKAREVLSEIQAGKDFAEAAKEHSTGPSGANGGDLGYFAADAMVKPFSDAAFAMQVGEVSSEPVQTEFGWHIIKVEDRRETPQPGLEEVRDQISQQLTQTVASEILDGLRGAANIEKFDMTGNPAPQEAPAPQQ